MSGGTAGAFAGSGINRETIAYVESFVPKASGPNYVPHVTVGVAKEDFVKRLKAERFKAFTAKVDGVAIYQLGNFGTAAKKLWEHRAVDPLASWNDGAAKRSILDFIRRVTTEGGPDFVPVPERIAVFDNDGTLWAEQPMYFQVYFVLDRIKKLAPQHPEWKTTEPFASVLRGDLNSALAGGDRALLEMVLATHAGMTSDDFEELVTDWIATARHPSTGQPFTKMVYAPMLELLTTLRANGFTVFIVSGGGIEFVRTFSERIYGISRDRVVGSSIVTKYEMRDGSPVLVRRPEVHFIDDKAGKPVGIQQHVGRRPIAAFGNSDGDFEMLEWVTGGGGLRLGLLIHHDDGVREFAYDRNSSVGRLARALDEAPKRDWTVVSMKNDWNKVFTLPDP